MVAESSLCSYACLFMKSRPGRLNFFIIIFGMLDFYLLFGVLISLLVKTFIPTSILLFGQTCYSGFLDTTSLVTLMKNRFF